MQVTDKAEYITTIYTIEADHDVYIIRIAQNDWDEDVNIQTENGNEIDIDSELGEELINMCNEYELNKNKNEQ
jgi:hypothetical protein